MRSTMSLALAFAVPALASAAPLARLVPRAAQPRVVEVAAPSSRVVAPAAPSVTAFVGLCAAGPLERPVAVASLAQFEGTFGAASTGGPLGLAVADYFANGGEAAVVVRASRTAVSGLAALDAVDLVTLVCLPDADVVPADALAAAAYCSRRRALLLVDPPAAWATAGDARSGVGGFGDLRDAALFFPRLRQPDRPPCGAVAGVIARTDRTRGVWKSPAGVEAALAGSPQLAVGLGPGDEGDLTARGVNCLRALAGRGVVVRGARTLAGAGTEWTYLAVRRLALHVEESVDRGTRWVRTAPNGSATWSEVRAHVSDFLSTLWRAGALQGARPEQAWFVKVGLGETMSQGDLEQGRLVILLGLAPVKPAEFIVLRVVQRVAP